MRQISLLLLITLSYICYAKYWQPLINWIQTIQTDIKTQNRLEIVLTILALCVYAYLAVQFMKKKIMIL